MLKRLRRRGRRAAAAAAERMNFSAELPLGDGPLWRVQIQMLSEPQADGERLRLRAHVQTNLGSSLRPALQKRVAGDGPALPAAAVSPRTLAQRAGSVAQRAAARALALPGVRALAEPLLRLDLNTWVEVQASTASLSQGSRALLPQAERLAALGIVPRSQGDGPLLDAWAGEAPDGFAQVSLLQLDKRHLPEPLRRALGDQPFSLAAAIVNTAQQKK